MPVFRSWQRTKITKPSTNSALFIMEFIWSTIELITIKNSVRVKTDPWGISFVSMKDLDVALLKVTWKRRWSKKFFMPLNIKLISYFRINVVNYSCNLYIISIFIVWSKLSFSISGKSQSIDCYHYVTVFGRKQAGNYSAADYSRVLMFRDN